MRRDLERDCWHLPATSGIIPAKRWPSMDALLAALAPAAEPEPKGVRARLRRWLPLPVRIAIAGIVVLTGAAFTCPYLSVAPAYPTTYAVSPARYATHAIAQGAALYAENCAQCHGLRGRGDGPLATSLTNRPPDLVLLALPPDSILNESTEQSEAFIEEIERQRFRRFFGPMFLLTDVVPATLKSNSYKVPIVASAVTSM